MRPGAAIVYTAAGLATALVGLACAPTGPAPLADPTSQRTLVTGDIVGFAAASGAHAWLGIPYAESPVGERRWRAPRPPAPWSGVREALVAGQRCTQFASPLEGARHPGTPIGGEDCLYANVWAPRFAPGDVPRGAARLPVMLWIHGGGNTIGSGSFYDGGTLAARQRLVVVTFNYRLGPFGWFRHPALRGAGTDADDRSGNFGTLDIIRALRWVRENAEAFGGDPDNVTVFGESAGGTDTITMLLSPLADGLFQRAIVESGGTRTEDPAKAERLVEDGGDVHSSSEVLLALLQRDGLAADRAAARAKLATMTPAQVARYLRGTDAYTLLRAYQEDSGEGLGMVDLPRLFRDGHVLPAEEPVARLESGHYNWVPVVIGSNRDENKLFLFNDPKQVSRLFGIVPRLRHPDRYDRLARYMSRAWKAAGVDELAMRMRRAQGASVFAYRFDWDEQGTVLFADLSRMLGAAHAFEIPFVFGHFDLGREAKAMWTQENAPGRQALSAAMMSYWAQFAYTGDPGRGRAGDLPLWSAWDESSPAAPKYMILDTPAGGGERMSSDVVTASRVMGELASDPRFSTQEERCEVAARIAEWWPEVAAAKPAAGAATLACASGTGVALGGD